MSLRDYQIEWVNQIQAAWDAGHRNVMATMATGGGKASCISHIVSECGEPAVIIAHRNELVLQLSLTLTRDGVQHGIIAPTEVIREIVRAQVELYGRSLYSSRAPVRVAGVNTLVSRDRDRWFDAVKLVVVDEGHHCKNDNIWGRAVAMFPHARGLFPTAHALRGDGAGLGRDADGIIDALVVGPCGRDLISRGFLCDYRLICPPNDIDLSNVPIGSTGDYSLTKLRAATHESKQLVGSVTDTYGKFANGMLFLTFAVDVQAAIEFRSAFRAVGVSAEVITGETPTFVRAQLMRRFRAREILQIVSCEVLSEGIDVPGVEGTALARGTASFQLYGQQVGRMKRTGITDKNDLVNWNTYTDAQRLAAIARSPKPKGIIADHVGNVARHYPFRGLPDSRQTYSLEAEEKRSRKARPLDKELRVCLAPSCMQPFERVLTECPYCQTKVPAPARRATVEQVDGDLTELEPETLAALRAEVDHAFDMPRLAPYAPSVVVASVKKNLNLKMTAQMELRAAIALWAGWQLDHVGLNMPSTYRKFFLRFGRDVLTAQTLNATEANKLRETIQADLDAARVVSA